MLCCSILFDTGFFKKIIEWVRSDMGVISVLAVLAVCAALCSAVPTKAPRWTYNFQSPQAATNPVVYYDVVLVPTNTTLYLFKANTGALVWKFDYPSGDNGGYAAASSELIVVGTLHHVYGLSWNATLLWTFAAPGGTRPQPFNHFRPSFGSAGVYVTTGYTPLLKLSKATGAVTWTAHSTLGIAQLHATESLDGQSVYVVSAIGSTEYALALTASDAEYQWNVSGVVTIIVAQRMGVVFCQGGNATASTLRAASLSDGRIKYQLTYDGMAALDYYVVNTTLYVDVGPTQNPFPTTIIKYDSSSVTPQWRVQNVSFLFFIPCAKGIVNFGPEYVSAYEEGSGDLKWRYPATAVNDGAATENDVIVMITAESVIALDF